LTSKWARLQRAYLVVFAFLIFSTVIVRPKSTFYTSWSGFLPEIAVRLAFVLLLLALLRLGSDGGVSAIRITPAPPETAIEPEPMRAESRSWRWPDLKTILILTCFWFAVSVRSDWLRIFDSTPSKEAAVIFGGHLLSALAYGMFFSLLLPNVPFRWPGLYLFLGWFALILAGNIYMSRSDLFTIHTWQITTISWAASLIGAMLFAAFFAWLFSNMQIRWPRPIPFTISSSILFCVFVSISRHELFAPHGWSDHWVEWAGCVIGSVVWGGAIALTFPKPTNDPAPISLSDQVAGAEQS